jgi:hypothetical protein
MQGREGWFFTRLDKVQGVLRRSASSHMLCCRRCLGFLRLGSTIATVFCICILYSVFCSMYLSPLYSLFLLKAMLQAYT